GDQRAFSESAPDPQPLDKAPATSQIGTSFQFRWLPGHPMSLQINRTLAIVELMVDRPEGMALGELAKRLNLPKSAAHRLVSQLVQRNYMEQEAASQHYKLSMRLMILGFRHLSNVGLADVCQPELDYLAECTGE